jgi:uncharacterized repeat protein (TIGR01451 family)
MRRTALIQSTHVHRPLTARLAALSAAALLVGGVSLPAMAEETGPNDQSVAAAVSVADQVDPVGEGSPSDVEAQAQPADPSPDAVAPGRPVEQPSDPSEDQPAATDPEGVAIGEALEAESGDVGSDMSGESEIPTAPVPQQRSGSTDAGPVIAPAGESVQCTGSSFQDEMGCGELVVTKVDSTDGSALPGATFQLWMDDAPFGTLGPEDTMQGDAVTTSAPSGTATWSGLVAGAYLVEEVSPPDGYRLSGTAVQAFEIVGQQSSSGGDPEYQLVTLTFTNDRIPGEIKVKKVDEVGTKLAGVTFELFVDRNANNVIDKAESLGQKTTGTDGNPLAWGDLPWGTDYKVLEVSYPAGYTPKGDALTGPYVIDRGRSVTVTRVNNRIDIPTLDKSSEPAEPEAVVTGQLINYKITVKNEGALPLTNQTLVDVLPAGVALDLATVMPTGDTSTPGRISWTFDLGAFSALSFTYSAKVTAGFGSPNLVNTATWVEKNLTDRTEHPLKGSPVSATVPPPATVVVVDDNEAVDNEAAVANQEVDNQADGTTTPPGELAATGAAGSGAVGLAGLLAILAGGIIMALGRSRREQ